MLIPYSSDSINTKVSLVQPHTETFYIGKLLLITLQRHHPGTKWLSQKNNNKSKAGSVHQSESVNCRAISQNFCKRNTYSFREYIHYLYSVWYCTISFVYEDWYCPEGYVVSMYSRILNYRAHRAMVDILVSRGPSYWIYWIYLHKRKKGFRTKSTGYHISCQHELGWSACHSIFRTIRVEKCRH